MWARVRVSAPPPRPGAPGARAEAAAEVCRAAGPGDAVVSWGVELHTEGALPAAAAPRAAAVGDARWAERYTADARSRGRAALTHIKLVCVTRAAGRSSRAVRLPEPLAVPPGAALRVEVEVYRGPGAPPAGRPSVTVFEEPGPGLSAIPRLEYEEPQRGDARRSHMAEKRMGQAIDSLMRQVRELTDKFLRLNPSSDDRSDVDVKMAKCQALYEGENVLNLPIITHAASTVCFEQLVEKLEDKIRKYTAAPPVTPPRPPAKEEGLPWWGYVGIGLGGLAALAGIVYIIAPKAPAAAAPARGRAA